MNMAQANKKMHSVPPAKCLKIIVVVLWESFRLAIWLTALVLFLLYIDGASHYYMRHEEKGLAIVL